MCDRIVEQGTFVWRLVNRSPRKVRVPGCEVDVGDERLAWQRTVPVSSEWTLDRAFLDDAFASEDTRSCEFSVQSRGWCTVTTRPRQEDAPAARSAFFVAREEGPLNKEASKLSTSDVGDTVSLEGRPERAYVEININPNMKSEQWINNGQAGVFGKENTGTGIGQLITGVPSGPEWVEVVKELAGLATATATLGNTPDEESIRECLTQANAAAQSGDRGRTMQWLKKGGSFAFEFATKVGAHLVGEVIKKAIGMEAPSS